MGGFQDSVIGDDRPAPAAAPATQPTTSPSFIHQLMAPPQEDAELFLLVRPKIINQREK